MALKMISIVCMDVGSLIELVNLTLTLGIACHFYQHQQHEQNQKQGPIIQDGPYPLNFGTERSPHDLQLTTACQTSRGLLYCPSWSLLIPRDSAFPGGKFRQRNPF